MSKRPNDRRWEAARRKATRSLARISDEEDATIRRAAAADPDNPPLDDRMFARMRPATEVMPDIVRRARGQRGPQKSKPVKTLVSLRLDPDVIRHFRRSGSGWQSRINQALRRVAKLSKTARS
jgi:uncharacterized protein (DUF4415 family)